MATYDELEMGDTVKSTRTGRTGKVVGFTAPDRSAGEAEDSGLIEVLYDGDSHSKHTDPTYLTIVNRRVIYPW